MGAAELNEPAEEAVGELVRNAAAATTKLIVMQATRSRRERVMASSEE
jgi:hypothetical protein